MNALMRIRISINVQNAQAVAAAQGQIKALSAAARDASGASGSFGRSLIATGNQLEKFGKNTQWVGRQLQYNFTIPLAIIGGAAAKFAFDNQQAFTQVEKVYTDVGASTRKELDLLKTAFKELSNIFGINQAEVDQVGATWAQAGARGIGLAKSVKTTLEVMTLTGESAETATQQLISLQTAYGLSSDQLRESLTTLIGIDRESTVSFKDMIDSLTRSAGAARTAGIDIQHLGALTAAITPAAGTATQAGNSLKTVISRLFAPTKDVADVLAQVGININDVGWQSKNGAERLELLAKKFVALPPAQQAAFASIVGARFQFSRLAVLLRDIANPLGNYTRALQASADPTKNAIRYGQMLTTVLSSQPQQFKILWTQLQNALADIIIPLLPALLGLASRILGVVKAFANLNPAIQQLVLLGLLLLAVIGPITKYFGAFETLGGLILKVTGYLLGFRLGAAAQTAAISEAAVATEGASVVMSGSLTAAGASWGALAEEITIASQAITAAAATMAEAMVVSSGLGSAALEGLATTAFEATARTEATLQAFGGSLFMLPQEMGAAIAATSAELQALPIVAGEAGTETGAALAGGVEAGAALGAAGISAGLVAAIVAAVAAAIALIVIFRHQIADAFRAIWNDLSNWARSLVKLMQKAWYALPEIVRNAILAVFHVLQAGMKAVGNALSYLNPFARHSPSLVDQVEAGVDVIAKKYASLRGIGNVLRGALGSSAGFSALVGGLSSYAAQADQNEKILKAAQAFGNAGAIAVRGLYGQISALKSVLAAINVEYQRQGAVVQVWKDKLDAATDAVDRQQKVLDQLSKRADALKTALGAAQDQLDSYANAPIAGMRAMDDAIFLTDQAQKKLRLEMMNWEDVNGPIDDVNSRLSDLSGELETLQGKRRGLRLAGAGSDVLGPLGEQITAIQKARSELSADGGPFDAMQKQLESLQRQGERLDLEKSLKFDPLTRQVDFLSKGLHELPFNEIVAGIQRSKAQVVDLTARYNIASAAVDRQTAVVDRLKDARDAISDSYDAEKKKLDELGDAYDAVSSQISDMEQSINDLASAADAARQKKGDELSQPIKDFLAGATGDYEIPGGTAGVIQPEEGDLQGFVDDLSKKVRDSFGSLDIFEPLKDAWSKAWGWIDRNVIEQAKNLAGWVRRGVGDAIGAIGDLFKGDAGGVMGTIGAFFGRAFGPPLAAVKDAFVTTFSTIGAVIGWAWHNIIYPVLSTFGGIIRDDVLPVLGDLGRLAGDIFQGIGDIVYEVWIQVLQPVFDAIAGVLGKVIPPVLGVILGAFVVAWKAIGAVVTWAWNSVIKPVWDALWWFGANVLTPVIQLVMAIWLIAWAAIAKALKAAWDGYIYPTLRALWDVIKNVVAPVIIWWWHNIIELAFLGIKAAIATAWYFIKPIFMEIKSVIENVLAPVFGWLWHQIIEPAWNGILAVTKSVFGSIGTFIVFVINSAIDAFNTLAHGVNWIADHLNVKVHIDDIPKIGQGQNTNSAIPQGRGSGKVFAAASGGAIPSMEVGSGSIVAGIRAIVGEGSKVWPEYVIPTDPRHRQRAAGLFGQLGQDIGMYADGGIIGGIQKLAGIGLSALGSFGEWIGGTFAGPAYNIVRKAVQPLVDRIPIELVREAGNKVLDIVGMFFAGKDEETKAQQAAMAASGGAGPGGPVPPGTVRDWLIQAIGLTGVGMDWLGPLYARTMQESGGNPRAINLWDDNAKRGTPSKGLLQTIDATFRSFMLPGHGDIWNPVDNTIAAIRYMIAKYGSVFNLPRGGYALGGILNAIIPGLAGGGIVRARPGGTVVRLGEGGKDELVSPILSSGKSAGDTFNFFGDMEFPNVKSGEDASDLVENLKLLAGKK